MKFLLSITIALFFIHHSSCFSQWSADPAINTGVCTSLDKQTDIRMIPDGNGGVIITWQDFRNAGVPDIYVQKMNSAGVSQWLANGSGICIQASQQNPPSICTDGAGGAIVSWSDWRGGVSVDIYAQRINSLGAVMWGLNGIAATEKPLTEDNQKIISDGSGGAYIVWEQQDAMANWDVWVQRVNSGGVTVWAAGGIPVSTTASYKINPRIEVDSAGGAIITWQDFRNNFDYDIYAQRLDGSGTRLWGDAGIAICKAASGQLEPKIDPNQANGGAYISWIDNRSGVDYDLYAQSVDSSGNIEWDTSGVIVCGAPGNQSAPDIMSSPDVNGVIVTWKDQRSGNFDIYCQLIDPSGNAQWAANGIAVNTEANDQLNPNICEDFAGGGIIVWQDSSTGNWNVKGQRVTAVGFGMWGANGVDLGIAANNQIGIKNVTDGAGGTIVAFQDKRSGVFDIYAHHLFEDGYPIGIKNKFPENIFSVFPNPFSNFIQIEPGCENCLFRLSSIEGKEIFSGKNIANQNFSNLSPGVYFLNVFGSESQMNFKLVKE